MGFDLLTPGLCQSILRAAQSILCVLKSGYLPVNASIALIYLPNVLVYPDSPSLRLVYSVYSAYLINGCDWLPIDLTHHLYFRLYPAFRELERRSCLIRIKIRFYVFT